MHLTANQADLLARVMTTLAEPHGERETRLRLGPLLLDLLGAQHYASYRWDAARQCFDGGVHLNISADHLAQYAQHYQFHDPITATLQRHRQAVRVTDVMPQSELRRTAFFNDFLARDGLHWGVNLCAWDGASNRGDLRIWRDRRRENFGSSELELLNLLRPALVAALRRGQAEQAGAEDPIPSALALLSARERDVARLVASGLTDKDMAQRLGIAPATVRTHIDHAFRKLGVNSRLTLVRRLGL